MLALAVLAATTYASNPSSAGVLELGAGDASVVAPASVEFQTAQLPQVVAGDECYSRSDDAQFLVGTANVAPSVPGFDSSLGTLSSVSVETLAFITSMGWVRNDSVNPFVFYVETGRSFNAGISGPGISGSAVTDFSSIDIDVPANPNLPAMGNQFPVDLISDVSSNVQTPTSTVAYEAATVTFPATSAGDFVTPLPPDGAVQVQSLVNVAVTVTYCYTPAAPLTSTITISSAIELGGSTGIAVPTASYTVSCSNGFTGPASILGTGSTTVDIGVVDSTTTCTVTQAISSPAEWSTTVSGTCTNVATGVLPGGSANFANVLAASASNPC